MAVVYSVWARMLAPNCSRQYRAVASLMRVLGQHANIAKSRNAYPKVARGAYS